jgi:aspartokinase
LANGEDINTVLDIIERKIKARRKIAIVVSARGKATDRLDDILTIAAKTELQTFREFKTYQKEVLMQSIFRQNLIN